MHECVHAYQSHLTELSSRRKPHWSVLIQTRLLSASVHTLFCSSVWGLQHAKCVCSCFLEMTRLTACKWSFIFFPNPCVVRILSSSGNSVCRHPSFSNSFSPGINHDPHVPDVKHMIQDQSLGGDDWSTDASQVFLQLWFAKQFSATICTRNSFCL